MDSKRIAQVHTKFGVGSNLKDISVRSDSSRFSLLISLTVNEPLKTEYYPRVAELSSCRFRLASLACLSSVRSHKRAGLSRNVMGYINVWFASLWHHIVSQIWYFQNVLIVMFQVILTFRIWLQEWEFWEIVTFIITPTTYTKILAKGFLCHAQFFSLVWLHRVVYNTSGFSS